MTRNTQETTRNTQENTTQQNKTKQNKTKHNTIQHNKIQQSRTNTQHNIYKKRKKHTTNKKTE